MPASRTARAVAAVTGFVAAATVVVWATWRVPAAVPLAAVSPLTPAAVSPAGPSLRVSTGRTWTSVGDGSVSPPVRLDIPVIGVDTAVVPETTGPDGDLAIPPAAEVGWYEAGPGPGQPGTTVLAGHIDDFGTPGAFLRLTDVPVGASVMVLQADGTGVNYVVASRMLVAQQALGGSGLLRSVGPSELALVSCGGSYDEASHLYLDNVVLIATAAPSTT